MADQRFVVDAKGGLASADGTSPLAGRSGYFKLQQTSPDWIVLVRSPAQGGIVEKEAPLQISNVALFNPMTQKPDRVGIRVLEDGRKVRFFKSNGEVVDV